MNKEKIKFGCADLSQPAIEAIKRYEKELNKLTGRSLILVAYEEIKR